MSEQDELIELLGKARADLEWMHEEAKELREQRDFGLMEYGEGAVDETGESYYNPVWLTENVKGLTCYDLDNLCFAIGEYEYQRQKEAEQEATNEP